MFLISNNLTASKKTINLFKQISAQEHFQSYALYPNCQKYATVAYKLLSDGKNDEKIDYKLPFVAPVKK
jgi:hypothetical protein